MIVSIRRSVAVIAAALLATTSWAATSSAAEPPVRQPVAMVINGGVSLGSYQAGVTYGLLRFLRERREGIKEGRRRGPGALLMDGVPLDFQIATGSSAGNINAFLAALSWCDQESFTARDNLFWDSWINVGLDKLSPTSPLQRDYVKLFEHPAARDMPTAPEALRPPHDPWQPDRSIYSKADGLLTRRAFLAGFEHLAARLQKARYRECLVKVGITATRADVVRLGNGAAAQRFVVPLELATTQCNGTGAAARDCELAVRNRRQWLVDLRAHRDIGKYMLLPEEDGRIPHSILFDLIKASSAFPIAFAPQPLQRYAEEPCPRDPSKTCLVHRTERFIDGGLFDNIPLGLAFELDDKPAKNERAPVYIYVDDSARRPERPTEVTPVRSNGLAALLGILGNFVVETRRYELQALQRNPGKASAAISDGQVFTTSRLMPLAGDHIAAFGAFPRIAFRKTDYYIGIYDAIYTLAEALGSRVPPERFRDIQKMLLDGDPELMAFTDNLFAYERYWTGLVDTTPPTDRCRVDALTSDVRDVFEALCRVDQEARILARSGSQAELLAHARESAGFRALLDRSSSTGELGDLNEWSYSTMDRLLRRAIDVEGIDTARLATWDPAAVPRQEGPFGPLLQGTLVRDMMLLGRLALASGMERPSGTMFTTSSVGRVTAGRLTPGALFHLFPYYLSWDSVRSRAEVGWEAKLRFGRALVAIDPALNWSTRDRSDGWSARLFLGIGCDPAGRMLDDIQLGPVFWAQEGSFTSTLSDAVRVRTPESVGAELSAHLLGSKLRVAVGPPMLIGRKVPGDFEYGRIDSRFSTLLDGFYFNLGFSDLNGTLAWLFRSGGTVTADLCEESCDDEPRPPRPPRRTSRLPAGKAYP
jgi:predicted acylesterase/phospholipase RssA